MREVVGDSQYLMIELISFISSSCNILIASFPTGCFEQQRKKEMHVILLIGGEHPKVACERSGGDVVWFRGGGLR